MTVRRTSGVGVDASVVRPAVKARKEIRSMSR
jgi:hypothetical protein